ncbi:MAG: DNA topoisomerase I [Candidatus Peregrinibacteria bacterium Greene0416_19]|nr:MAG: DNA topoisomerase I [Candidatus Peregrinibacteria bacterium Greene0416_19]
MIPPAWTDVWICPDARGHLQATGRDSRDRKQYRYHPRFRSMRDEGKYDRLIAFSRVLPRIRRHVSADLRRPGLPRQKVLGVVIRLLDETHLRIGNDEYARENHSYGLTTLRDRHADVRGSTLCLRFRGKSGQLQHVKITDRRVARIVHRCQELPGQELFQYVDDRGRRHRIASEDVNTYLKGAAGADFTAKDFRTWGGTVCAALALKRCCGELSRHLTRHNIVGAVKEVARVLGNRPATCRKYYIDPRVIRAYESRCLSDAFNACYTGSRLHSPRALRQEEQAVVQLLSKSKRAVA